MSQFSRTAAQVDTLEQKLKDFQACITSSEIPERKSVADSVHALIGELRPTVDKFISKAEAGVRDPNKRIYGAAMVTKIFALRDRFNSISDQFSPMYETLQTEWEKHLEQVEEKKKIDEQKRLAEEEEQKKKLEEENRQREQAEAEAVLKKQQEEEKLRLQKEAEEKQKKLEEEAKQERLKAEEEEKKKAQELENKKKEEEEKAKLEAAAKLEQEKKEKEAEGFTITIKTNHGVTHSLPGVSPTQTVAQLKEAIEKSFGVLKAAQRLIFQGRLLADANPISTYKIVDGSAIHLVENARAAAAAASSASASSAAATKPEKWTVPPGTVCHLRDGKDEMDAILNECGSRRLVVVDWFAPWCGPCRMIAPVFERLANRFSDVTFIKVDTEASGANAALASEKQISAYPTFHFIVNHSVRHSFSGANATSIESNIKKYRAMVTSSSTSGGASSSGGGSTLGPVGARVMASLTALQRNLSMDDFIIAVRTLLKFVRNIVENPGQEKFRRVRTANTTFQSRLGSKQGGVECMRAFGFRDVTENGENFLVISAASAEDPELRTVMSQLESAVEATSGSSGGSSSHTRATPTPPTPSPIPGMDAAGLAGMFGGAGGAGGAPDPSMHGAMASLMQDPSFQQMTRDLMADPEAMQIVMQAQQAYASGDMATVQQLQQHPAMLRMQQAMTSNPAFLSVMMRQVAERGFPGLGGGAGGGAGGGMGLFGGMNGANNNAGAQQQQQQQQQGGAGGMPTPTPPQPQPPAFAGAPSSQEEEERLLQEAIRLSMQDQQQNKSEEERREGGDDDSPDKSS